MRKSIILIVALIASLNMNAQTIEKQDSLNIPVYLVDGVEVQSIDDLDQKDIISVDVIKNSALTRIFYPRTGGIISVTTKSKKYLKPLIQKHQEDMKKAKGDKKPGPKIYIKQKDNQDSLGCLFVYPPPLRTFLFKQVENLQTRR